MCHHFKLVYFSSVGLQGTKCWVVWTGLRKEKFERGGNIYEGCMRSIISVPPVRIPHLSPALIPRPCCDFHLLPPHLSIPTVPSVENQIQFNCGWHWAASISHVWAQVGRRIVAMCVCLNARAKVWFIVCRTRLSSVDSAARTKIYGLDFLLLPFLSLS